MKNETKKFKNIYPDKEILLINVVNADTEVIHKSILFKDKGLTIIQFVFSDVRRDEDKELPKWMGNKKGWDCVMDTIEMKSNQTDL